MRGRCAYRLSVALGVVVAAGCLAAPVAAEPPPAPAPPVRQVIGPAGSGPPAYPPAVGVPLIPRARSGVAAAVGALSPTPQQSPAPVGIAGVQVGADTVIAIPRAVP